jgi:SagB-type dehydrogenase family enzyme
VAPLRTIALRPLLAAAVLALTGTAALAQQPAGTIRLPEPRRQGTMSLEAALAARHSTRALTRDSLDLADVAQLLWAAQGINRPDGHRTAPAAGGIYALELYIVAARVRGLPAGVYHYRQAGHILETVSAGDRLQAITDSATHQAWQGDAAVAVVFASDYGRLGGRFRDRAERYVPMEVGFAAQNVYLEVAALGLGTTFAGSFQDSTMARLVGLAVNLRPLGIMPVGRPR